MSEINKPENLNANLSCSFNPDLYQFNGFSGEVTVPIGSLAWALSHVYLKKQLLYCIGWNAPKEHIRLAHQTIANSEGDGSPYIEKSDKNGYWLPWEPTQEDLMACDWKILMLPEPPPYWISFDLKIGSFYMSHGVGYSTEEAMNAMGNIFNAPTADFNVGTLSNFQNKTTPIREIIAFIKCGWTNIDDWESKIGLGYNLTLIVSCDKNNRQKTAELLSRDLYLTVDDKIYKFSVSDPYLPPKVDGTTMTVVYGYMFHHNPNDERRYDIDELYYSIMKNNIGKTKHFHLSWYDK
ncbi:MW1434 family type I TA system toxin [Xenorhabdus griffiniae]|uniref:Thoeris anti-defense Tad2 family protein n=1 Tax=Xenorhabdus griffiniae TaxID=351672 RepID=UPI0030D27690